MRDQLMGIYFSNEKNYRWININTVPQYKPGEEKPYQVFVTFEDVTERKKAEDALGESYQLLQTIIDTTPLRIFWKDKEMRYLGCNPAFAADADTTNPGDLIGKNDYQLVWKEQAELYRADDQQVMNSGIPKISFNEPQVTPEGEIM